jgi:hypothetical protein
MGAAKPTQNDAKSGLNGLNCDVFSKKSARFRGIWFALFSPSKLWKFQILNIICLSYRRKLAILSRFFSFFLLCGLNDDGKALLGGLSPR